MTLNFCSQHEYALLEKVRTRELLEEQRLGEQRLGEQRLGEQRLGEQ